MQSGSSGSARLYDLLGWLEKNKTPVLAAIVILAAVILTIAIKRANEETGELEANRAFFGLSVESMANEDSEGASPRDFLQVAEQHSGTPAGSLSRLMAARGYFLEGNYDKAQETFSQFLTENPHHDLAPIAALGIAASLESKNLLQKALTEYRQVTTRYPEQPAAAQARFAIGRLQEALDKPEQAVAEYDQLAESEKSPYWAQQARTRREQLYKKFPELKPEEPAATPEASEESATTQPAETEPAQSTEPEEKPAETQGKAVDPEEKAAEPD